MTGGGEADLGREETAQEDNTAMETQRDDPPAGAEAEQVAGYTGMTGGHNRTTSKLTD